MDVQFLFAGILWEKIFIVIFTNILHKNSNLMKENTQKYNFNVKFIAQSNPVCRNDGKNFFYQCPTKNNVKLHIGHNFEYCKLIFNESSYFLVKNKPVNWQPILNFYLLVVVSFRWNPLAEFSLASARLVFSLGTIKKNGERN